MKITKLKTGDILCNVEKNPRRWSIFGTVIRLFTRSSCSHVAIILKDPSITFFNSVLKDQCEKSVHNIYVTEFYETFNQTSKHHCAGFHITPIEEFFNEDNENNKSYKFLKLKGRQLNVYERARFENFIMAVKDRDYESVGGLLLALFRINIGEDDKRFFCSEYVLSSLKYTGVCPPAQKFKEYSSNCLPKHIYKRRFKTYADFFYGKPKKIKIVSSISSIENKVVYI